MSDGKGCFARYMKIPPFSWFANAQLSYASHEGPGLLSRSAILDKEGDMSAMGDP